MIALQPVPSHEYQPTAYQASIIESCLDDNESLEDVIERALENFIKDEKTEHKSISEDFDD